MGARRLAVVLVLAVGWTLVTVAPAGAAPVDKICQIVERRLVCTTDAGDAGRSGATGPSTGAPSAVPAGSPTAVWTSELLYLPAGPPDGATAAGPCTAPNGQPGMAYRHTLRSLETGEVLRITFGCVAPGEAGGPPAAPPSPPQPPTFEEIVAATPIPAPEIAANPSGRGLTGIDSWFWAADPGTVDASATLRGWTVSGSLSIGGWVWDTGDGGRYETDGPGTADAPAVEHTYEAKGTWPVSLEVRWSGSYTVSGYGTSFTVGGLSVEGSDSLDYEVIEVRGVVDDRSA